MPQIVYKNASIHYLRFGTGSKSLIALHGYGDTAALYKVLLPSLGERYTFYSIDLPYHGRTHWAADRLYSVQDIAGMVEAVCQTEHIATFSLMGYSMGGRLAMCIVPALIDRIEELFIIAASGIKIHPIFNAATLPAWVIRLLSVNIRYPASLFASMRLAKSLGIVSHHVYRFNRRLMATENRRRRMHYTWLSIREFKVNIPRLQQLLNQVPTPVYLFFGDRDEIIPPWVGEFFAKGLRNMQLHLVAGNHFIVNEQLNNVLGQLWRDE